MLFEEQIDLLVKCLLLRLSGEHLSVALKLFP